MVIYESAEDYLEKILILSYKQTYVRSIDIAKEMGFAKASVSLAMKSLRDKGLILFDEKNHIILTQEGVRVAEKTLNKHIVITKALTLLGVPEDIAKKDVRKIEHDLSDCSFDAIQRHVKKHQ